MPRRLAVPMLALSFCLALLATAFGKPRDRDHDRLPDKWEKRYHLSTKHRSTKRDPDHDRLRNLREYRAQTNPRRRDTDRDGLSDYAEVIRYKTNPRRADTDGDGFSDGAEVRAGTDPHKRASHPGTGSAPPGGSPPGGGAAGGCAGSPNTPDGPDPWGGCFPGPASTGVPPGTNLTPYTGPCTITAANTVIDGKTVNCYLEIRAPGVVIRNSLINGRVWIGDPAPSYSFTITDSTVDAGPVDTSSTHVNDGTRAIGASHFVATRVETIRGVSGIFCEYDCTVRDSWVHGQDTDEGGYAHQSGIRMGSGASQHIFHTSLVCDAKEVQPDAGCSADLTGYGDWGPIQNNLIERNLFLWSESSATCAYGGSTPGKQFPNGTNNVFRDNVFQRGPGGRGAGALGHCGFWFAILHLDAGQRGNQWVNNRWDTGELVPSDG
jgi:hypothetical protein